MVFLGPDLNPACIKHRYIIIIIIVVIMYKVCTYNNTTNKNNKWSLTRLLPWKFLFLVLKFFDGVLFHGA